MDATGNGRNIRGSPGGGGSSNGDKSMIKNMLKNRKNARQIISIQIDEAIQVDKKLLKEAKKVPLSKETILTKKKTVVPNKKRIREERDLAEIKQLVIARTKELEKIKQQLHNFVVDTLEEVSKIHIYGDDLLSCNPDSTAPQKKLQTSLCALHKYTLKKDNPNQVYKKKKRTV